MKIPERVKVDKGIIVIERAIQENGNTGREKQRQLENIRDESFHSSQENK